jgi:MFS family permease
MMALTMAFVGETVPKEKTGSAMGLLGTMSAIGTALGPSLGGFLIAGPGWRAIFLVNVPLGVVAFALAYRYLPADRGPKTDRAGFDAMGMLLLALTLGAYALAMTLGRGSFGVLNIALPVFSLGTVSPTNAMVSAIMTAAPAPCAARAAISNPSVGATPHRADASVNTVSPASSSRRRPMMSPSRPAPTMSVVMARR